MNDSESRQDSFDLRCAVGASVAVEDAASAVAVGQWYWVKGLRKRKSDPINPPEGYCRLGCVVWVGSNYVEISMPRGRHGQSSIRVHFDNFWDELLFEPDAEAIIRCNIQHHRTRVSRQMAHVQRINKELGVPTQGLLSHSSPSESAGTGIMVLNQASDLGAYQKTLAAAQKRLLPKLFARIKAGNQHLATWLSAESTSLNAAMDILEASVEEIDQHVFNVSLYAGLTENCVCIRRGELAGYNEKVSLMQRMLFMDEECLLNYQAGGMAFYDIRDYDRWLSDPVNYQRLLPFPKCVAAFRVRRHKKERYANNLTDAFINLQLDREDAHTFLYIRNGEALYRLSLEDFEFGEKLFPDAGSFDASEPMMLEKNGDSMEDLITLREYEARVAEDEMRQAKRAQWFEDNPYKEYKKRLCAEALARLADSTAVDSSLFHTERRRILRAHAGDHMHRKWIFDNPFARSNFIPARYQPFDSSNVFYDDILEDQKAQVEMFNRMALIIQGLFDRSDVFQPCPPARTWEADGFKAAIHLVYDASMALHYGEAPDFEAYREHCNARADKDSLFVGQELFWLREVAIKEGKAHIDSCYIDNYLKPYGNPGPGLIAKPASFHPRAKKAKFAWQRKSRDWRYGYNDKMVRAVITVPLDQLLNVSAYTPGDYKRFFCDPRTRQKYLQWAPLLLAAEDYYDGHSGE